MIQNNYSNPNQPDSRLDIGKFPIVPFPIVPIEVTNNCENNASKKIESNKTDSNIIENEKENNTNSNKYVSDMSEKSELPYISDISSISYQDQKGRLEIRGVEKEKINQFKYFASVLGLKHAAFFELLLGSFVEHNSTIENKLTNQKVNLTVNPIIPQKKFIVRSLEADRILKDTSSLLPTISKNALIFRCEEQLRPFLFKPIPDEQKEEIVQFLELVRGKYL